MRINIKNHLLPALNESLKAVLPIILIVVVLSVTCAPIPSGTLLCFLFGAVLLIIGMMFFSLGADMALSPIGDKVGSSITKSKNFWLLIVIAFFMGIIITIAEPDLQVLATQVPSVPNLTLIITVGLGVGAFLVVAMLRMLLSVRLSRILLIAYAVVFALAFFVPPVFLSVAFDAGGVTTGPMTVPFIMAFGVGVCAIRSDKHAGDDTFGLVALCSVGPILAVMFIGIVFGPEGSTYTGLVVPEAKDTADLAFMFSEGFPTYMKEMALSLLPIFGAFLILEVTMIHMPMRSIKRILVGLVYAYIGLVLFLTGANVGFMPTGYFLGEILSSDGGSVLVVAVAMLMGFFVVRAEPAVHVLNKQVEEITDGAISSELMGWSLSIGVAVSCGLSLIRVLTGISILWFLLPGYAIAIITSFFVPKMYTAIAFDSGGVASGPMTTAFLLPFAQGACVALGGDVVKDAFGVVAMVAMTPLITIQVLGLVTHFLEGRRTERLIKEKAPLVSDLDENLIIDL